MPIETQCSGCGSRLRVGDEHAGKKARCPGCGELTSLPAAHESSPAASVSSAADSPSPSNVSSHTGSQAGTANTTPSSAGPVATSGNETRSAGGPPQWLFRSENGHIYGPIGKAELQQWANEGRVSRSCHLQLVGGDGRWESAAGWIGTSTLHIDDTTPYEPSVHYAYGRSNHVNQTQTVPMQSMRRSRGTLVMVFAILGIGCPVFSMMAAIIGYLDLQAMREFRMESSGRNLTSFAMGLGILFAFLQIMFFVAILAN